MKLLGRIGISLGVAIIAAFTVSTSVVEDLDLRVFDQLLRIRGKQKPPAKIVVIAIDELSYRELNVPFGPTWPRQLHAQLLDKLREYGVKRVAFDVLFVGPGTNPDGDAALASAFTTLPTAIGVEFVSKYVSNPAGGYFFKEIDLPFQPFREASRMAIVGLPTQNGVVRQFPVARPEEIEESRYPFLAEAAIGLSVGDNARRPGPRDLIRYYGPSGAIPTVSYYELFKKELPGDRERFKDAIVFVGILLRSDTGAAQKDSYQTPFGGMVFGVEVHATIANNLLSESWISRPGRFIELTAQSLLLGTATFLGMTVTPVILALFSTTLIIVWAVIAFIGLTAGFFLCGAGSVLVGMPAILLASTVYSYLTARKSEESLKSAFSLYLSPEMIPELSREKNALKLGGEKLWLTALFTDIADFTSITEEMPAEKTSEMLNAYFTEVMEVIFQNQGTLIKFIGDAVFAIWGAPVKMTNHAELALKTALAIEKEVAKFNATQRFPPLITRIGLNTGPMLVGNLGSKRRFDYTAIGDSVNLAARLEGLNKYFGTLVLFSEATRKDAGGFAGAILIGRVRVKGKKEAVELFTLFDPPLSPSIASEWNDAFEEFSSTNFSAAYERYEMLKTAEPRLTKAADLYQREITKLLSTTPAQGWRGELEFESK